MAAVVEKTWTSIVAGGTEVAVTLDAGGAADGNTLLAFITKDDDVATTGPAGWTLVQGFESNNAIYSEIWKREASSDKTPTYSGNSFSVTTEEIHPHGLAFNPDGTKFFMVGVGSDTVYEYTVSVGFDLSSTVAYSGNSFSVGAEDTAPTAIVFSGDGTKFLIVGLTNDAVYEYTVSVGFDLSSTVAYSGNSFSIGTEEINPRALAVNTDGTKFFVLGQDADNIYEYTCSVGFDLSSTVAYSGNSFSVGTEEISPQSLAFNPDGTKFFIVGHDTDTVYEYTCSVGYDLSSTVAYSGNSFSVGTEDATPLSLTFNPDGTKFFIAGATNDTVYEYDCSAFLVNATASAYTWTGDSEEYTASITDISGADYTTIAVGTLNVGTDAVPISNSVTPAANGAIILAGFGVDGDSTPLALDAALTSLSNIQSSTGAGSAGQAVGYEIQTTAAATGTYTHSMDSADQWTGFTVFVEEAVATTAAHSIVGAQTITASIAATFNFTLNADIVGSQTVTVTPTATLDYRRNADIVGAQTISVSPAATLLYRANYDIIGAQTVSVTPTAALDYRQHLSIAGSQTITATPSATLNYTLNADIVGSQTVTVTPAATLLYSVGSANHSIVGAQTITASVAGVTQYQQHLSIVGAGTITATPAATFNHTLNADIVGGQTIAVTPTAALDYRRNADIVGAQTIAASITGVTQYQQHPSIVGNQTVALSVGATLNYTLNAAIVGSVTITNNVTGTTSYTRRAAIVGGLNITIIPAAALSLSFGGSTVSSAVISLTGQGSTISTSGNQAAITRTGQGATMSITP